MILYTVIFIFMVEFAERGKTENIGKFSWYTEKNSFAEILQVAQKANKPILAVFSATWCGPCRQLKANVFKSDDFKRVAKEVILFFIEQTTKEGTTYYSKYNVTGSPAFRIFSSQGILLDSFGPERTVDGFLEWIHEVKAGNSLYELSERLKKKSNDREILVKITDKLLWNGEKELVMEYLQRAIKMKPEFNDEFSQRAYEKLAYLLEEDIRFKESKEKEEYLASHQKIFQDIVDAYYPDKFKYELAGNYGMSYILNWFYQSQQFKKVLAYFNDFLKRNGDSLNFIQDIPVFAIVIPNFIFLGKANEVDSWIVRIRDFSIKNENSKSDQSFIHIYSGIFTQIIKTYGEMGLPDDSKKYTRIFSEEMSRLGQGLLGAVSIIDQAMNIGKLGKKEEAKKSLLALYKNKVLFNSLNKQNVPYVLNSIARTMVELKLVDCTSLEIAKKSVILSPTPANKDTLACVHAELGNFNDAVRIEKEALSEEKNESVRQKYSERVHTWQIKIK